MILAGQQYCARMMLERQLMVTHAHTTTSILPSLYSTKLICTYEVSILNKPQGIETNFQEPEPMGNLFLKTSSNFI